MIFGLAILAVAVVIARLPNPIASFPVFLPATAAIAVLWILAVRQVARTGRGSFAFVLIVAAAMRGLWLLPDVPLSDDLYRYLWDGRVANAGIHPFAHAPSDEELAFLRNDVWKLVNHPDVPTIYPPVAQLVFRVVDRVLPTPGGVRLAFALCDLAVVAFLAGLLRRRGRPAALAVVYAWCPLAALESAAGGHVDALGVALFVLGLAVLESRGPRAAAVAGFVVGASCLVKPVAVLASLALLRDRGPRERILLVAGALASLLLVVPYADVGAKLFTGFGEYARHWRFNDLAYGFVAAVASPERARLVLAVALAATALLVPRLVRDPLSAAGLTVGAMLCLSPTVHPWYVVWLVPFLPFLPRAFAPAGFTLVAVVPVAYLAAFGRESTGDWHEPSWLRLLTWGPVGIALVAGVVHAARNQPRSAARKIV